MVNKYVKTCLTSLAMRETQLITLPRDWAYSSVVQHLPDQYKVLSSIPNTEKQTKKPKQNKKPTEGSPCFRKNGWHQEIKCWLGCREKGHFYIVGGNVNWYNHDGPRYGEFHTKSTVPFHPALLLPYLPARVYHFTFQEHMHTYVFSNIICNS